MSEVKPNSALEAVADWFRQTDNRLKAIAGRLEIVERRQRSHLACDHAAPWPYSLPSRSPDYFEQLADGTLVTLELAEGSAPTDRGVIFRRKFDA